MTRKLLLAAAAFTMTFAVSTADVDAQRCFNRYNEVITCTSSPTISYPGGGFTSSGAAAAAGSSNTIASTTTTSAGTAETSQGLAFTGANSGVLGYVGAGLVGLGGLALVGARRSCDDDPTS